MSASSSISAIAADVPAWPAFVCPIDASALAAESSGFTCASGHAWPVEDGIPRFTAASNYGDAFGLQWNTYRRTQLDSYTGLPISLNRARKALGEACWSLLSREARTDVLEVGCGAGRFTEILLSTGAFVTSSDLSSAVTANAENFKGHPRQRVIQADVLTLPFRPRQFDFVFCLGVVQHTPKPEETIARLYEQVRPGGWLVLDHYTFTLSHLTKLSPLFRMVLRRLPPDRGLVWSERIVNTLFPLHRLARHSRVAQALLSRVSPVRSYYHAFPLGHALQKEWALLDTHDVLTDWYKHLRTKGQIRQTLDALGAADVYCEYGGNGVEARCRRPINAG